MRGVKLRAWDETHKEWVEYGFCLRFDVNGECQILNAFAQPFTDRTLLPVCSTGLFDTTGKEIYEGDIIKATSAKADRIAEACTGRVYWREDEFQWWITDGTDDPTCGGIDYDLTYLRHFQDIQVVGNIYENPGLVPL